MIPSRPLYLGDIIGNTFVIAVKTWTRTAVAALLFLTLPMLAFYFTASGFVETVHDALETEGYLTPDKLGDFRVEIIRELRDANPVLLELYGIPADAIAEPVDEQAGENVNTFRETDVDEFVTKYGDSFLDFAYWAIFSYLFLLLGSLGYQVVAIDLASRQFEERKLNLWQAIKDTLRSYLWISILQYMVLIFVLMFGLGASIQIGVVLAPTVAALLLLAAIIMTVIAALRALFAQPALVSEDLGPIASLKRSWEISRGHGWRIFGTLLVFAIIMFVVYVMLSIPMTGITSSVTETVISFLRGTEMNPERIFSSLHNLVARLVLVMLLTSVIFASLSPSFLTVFYYDLRTRKDGPLVYHEDSDMESDGPVLAS